MDTITFIGFKTHYVDRLKSLLFVFLRILNLGPYDLIQKIKKINFIWFLVIAFDLLVSKLAVNIYYQLQLN